MTEESVDDILLKRLDKPSPMVAMSEEATELSEMQVRTSETAMMIVFECFMFLLLLWNTRPRPARRKFILEEPATFPFPTPDRGMVTLPKGRV